MSTNEAAEALDLATESLALNARSGEDAADVIARGLVALAHARLGHTGPAAEAREVTLSLVRRAARPTSFGMLCAYATLADVCLSAWEANAVHPVALEGQQASAACRALNQFAAIFPIGRPRAALHEGRRLWLTGRRARAVQRWEQAIADARHFGMSFDEGLAALALGAHLPAGDPRRLVHLSRAREVFVEVNADYERARADATLAGHASLPLPDPVERRGNRGGAPK